MQACKTGLSERAIADLLSQNSVVGADKPIPMSRSTKLTQVRLVVAEAKARYSASIEERETVDCRFADQKIRFEPSYVQKPVVDRLVVLHLAQSASEKPYKCMKLLE